MKMLFLVPIFAFAVTLIVEYLLPAEMPRRKRIAILCLAGLLSLAFGSTMVILMFKSL